MGTRALDLDDTGGSIGANSAVYLDIGRPLRRLPLAPELDRPRVFLDRFDFVTLFHDVFRDVKGNHVYLIGPMALNLTEHMDALTIVGHPSGKRPKVQRHHGVQVFMARVRLPADDTHLSVEVAGQTHKLAIQPNRSGLLAGQRVVSTINKNNKLEWIADWARFYVAEHGATAVVIYDNGSTDYGLPELRQTLAAVPGLTSFLVVAWPFPFGMMNDVYDEHRFGDNWAMFAQPPSFAHMFRKYAMRARSLLNVDIDELVVSPYRRNPRRRSVFGAIERALFGTLRFNRIWVQNMREGISGMPRHRDFVIRKKGRWAKDVGKKWGLNPRRAWLASWRSQPWTHQIFGWINLAGSRTDFYGYHFIGISNSWYWDRTEEPAFDPQIHTRDPLLMSALRDVFGAEARNDA